MNHTCWLNTATQLRDRYGHDVLLLDFHGHGKSPRLSHYSRHTPEACAAQLRRVLLRVGWAHDGVDDDPHALHPDDPDSNPTPRVPLVLCGLSLGGVVSCLYADAHPRDVGRVILVSSPGLPSGGGCPRTSPVPFVSPCSRSPPPPIAAPSGPAGRSVDGSFDDSRRRRRR